MATVSITQKVFREKPPARFTIEFLGHEILMKRDSYSSGYLKMWTGTTEGHKVTISARDSGPLGYTRRTLDVHYRFKRLGGVVWHSQLKLEEGLTKLEEKVHAYFKELGEALGYEVTG